MLKQYFYELYPPLHNLSKRLSIELINQITAIISLPLIVNGLEFETYGFFTFCLFFSYLMGSISGWGIHVHIIESLASNKIDKDKINNYVSVSIVLKFIGLILYILGVLFFSNFVFQTLNISQQNLFILFILAFLIIFNPIELIQAFGKIEKILLLSIIGRLLFLLLLFIYKDVLNFSLLIYFFIIMMILPFVLGYNLIWDKINFINFLTVKNFSIIFGIVKKSKNTIFLFLENQYFFIILAFILSFKFDLYEIAIFNFLIQLFNPGLKLVEMSMRLAWQTIIKDAKIKKNLLSTFLVLFLISFFLLTSIFGFSLFSLIISNQSLLDVWQEIKLILYILCIEVIYFNIIYVYLYEKYNQVNQTENIIFPFLWLKIVIIPLIFFLDLNILNIFLLYGLIKVVQILLILIKVKLSNKAV